MMENNQAQRKKSEFKEHEKIRMFQEIEDQLTILTATAKFNYTTCKTDQKTLELTLAFIEDTKKLTQLLKNRINLLMEVTG